MKTTLIQGIPDAFGNLGKELGITDWLTIDQSRIDRFAEATGDHQWIHVDVERARRESPFGTTIAHGYLTLSLLAKFFDDCITVENIRMQVNYGFNRARFASPVKVDSRIRARFTLHEVTEIEGGAQVVWSATVDIEDSEKPALLAEIVARWYF